ncbi:thiamine phosphate synthase [Pseudanabaena sp. FACHB-2040]|uniref:thiamine phosphate synthase n=1 Tax=Pseudanabaena sp. FACHB-2040 TaxID=2692859 RepID=UPI001684A79A|nr:thiamine phosphate synthase [Pseudanabaena sp. FACHB-2040]MBD2260487.1 thiamine phosphate synthase [Pseudanabaena sp. FACHB-2040]
MQERYFERGLGEPVQFTELAIFRILDANLDRAREGLRIVEEWCRFGLNHGVMTEQIKHLRQTLAQWHTPQIRLARDTPGDLGTHLTHPQEAERSSLTAVLQANFCRVQEALRVLEEYGKLYKVEFAAACKNMRYQVYSLESELLGHHRFQQLMRSHTYLVTTPGENLFWAVEAALQGGVSIVQYRDKDTDDSIRLENARQLRELCHRYSALFIVNDRVDLALAIDADGVHLGQQDMPIAVARQILGSQRILGRSTTNPDEMARAIEEGADYIGVGPVYATPTKPGKPAAGLDYVRYAAEHASIPWFAIGSINPDNLTEVIQAGAERVAVVRAIMQAENPTLISQFFVAQLNYQQTLRAARVS